MCYLIILTLFLNNKNGKQFDVIKIIFIYRILYINYIQYLYLFNFITFSSARNNCIIICVSINNNNKNNDRLLCIEFEYIYLFCQFLHILLVNIITTIMYRNLKN